MSSSTLKASLCSFLLCALLPLVSISAQNEPLQIMVIGAHPDDADLCAGGTASLWAEMGHHVKFLSLTNGDAGHQNQGGGALAKRRRAEAQESARRLGIDEYETLDNHDGELVPSLDVRLQVIRKIREWKADVVISSRPNDYHPDHRNTGLVVQDAAYMVIVPNVASDTPPLEKNPIFLYCQDRFEKPNPFQGDIAVAIDQVVETKYRALDAHVSQFYEWLPWTAGMNDQVPEGKEERFEWLKRVWSRPVSERIRERLAYYYGDNEASKIMHAEAFDICEYGIQPDKAEIGRIFPMLPITPILSVHNVVEDIEVDGILDEPFYKGLKKHYLKNNMTKGIIDNKDYETFFYAFYDDDNIYFSFHSNDKYIKSTFRNRDDRLWEQEAVEVFIDTDDDPNDYVEIQVSPANRFYDSFIVDPYQIDVEKTKQFNLINHDTKVHVAGTLNNGGDEDQFWTTEIRIPLKELDADIENRSLEDLEWKINFYRIDRDLEPIKYQSWSPTTKNFHQPVSFGTLQFKK